MKVELIRNNEILVRLRGRRAVLSLKEVIELRNMLSDLLYEHFNIREDEDSLIETIRCLRGQDT